MRCGVKPVPAVDPPRILNSRKLTLRGVLGDQGDGIGVLREPDVARSVDRDAVRIAVRGGCGDLVERVGSRSERADLVGVVLGEPDRAVGSRGEAPRPGARRRHCELLTVRATGLYVPIAFVTGIVNQTLPLPSTATNSGWPYPAGRETTVFHWFVAGSNCASLPGASSWSRSATGRSPAARPRRVRSRRTRCPRETVPASRSR